MFQPMFQPSVSPVADIKDWESFLESNYYQLSRRIRVENLLGRLRSDAVLNQEDFEAVLNQYCTQFLKAGHLIDIIKTRGKVGFQKFMEAIEYEYPEVYFETTGKEPRQDPVKQHTSTRKRGDAVHSVILLEKMGDLIHNFTEQMDKKRLELRTFQDLVTTMQAELRDQTEEQRILEDRNRQQEEQIQQLNDIKKELTEKLCQERQAKTDVQNDFDKFRKDKLNEIYENSRPKVSKQIAINPYSTDGVGAKTPHAKVRQGSCVIEQGTVKHLTKAYQVKSSSSTTTTTTTTTTTEEEDLTKRGVQSSNDGDDITQLRENLCRLQESNDRYECCIEEFRKENEQCRIKQLEAESSKREIENEKEKLKSDVRKMEEQCKLMADMIRRLKNEIDSRIAKKKLYIPKMFPGTVSDDDHASETPSTGHALSSKGQHNKVGLEKSAVTSSLLQSSLELVRLTDCKTSNTIVEKL